MFGLDERRVLRVYRSATREYVERLGALYEEIAAAGLPFATPRILDGGESGGHTWCLQPRIPGEALSQTLPSMSAVDRRAALIGYLDAALAVHQSPFAPPYFGEVVADEALRRGSWVAFLHDRARAALDAALPDLQQDVPAIASLSDQFGEALHLVDDVREPRLVHGDYFPGNVLAQGTAISGVIDFGPLTVAGDWRMDVVGALIWLEVVDGYREEDSRFLKQVVAERAPSVLRVLDLYRAYYGMYFSFTKEQSPRLYAWCVRSLRDIQARGALTT